jgi:hypothetical protein
MFKITLYANIIFWIVSNYVCYLMWYERTLPGLLRCYLLAVPFFFGALAKTLIVVYGLKYLSNYKINLSR